jgi:hypothetical protein
MQPFLHNMQDVVNSIPTFTTALKGCKVRLLLL